MFLFDGLASHKVRFRANKNVPNFIRAFVLCAKGSRYLAFPLEQPQTFPRKLSFADRIDVNGRTLGLT